MTMVPQTKSSSPQNPGDWHTSWWIPVCSSGISRDSETTERASHPKIGDSVVFFRTDLSEMGEGECLFYKCVSILISMVGKI